MEDLDVVRSAEVVPKKGLVQTRTRLEQDGDGLSLGLARLGLEETVLLKVSQPILRLDVESSGTNEEDSLLILGRDEGLRGRPGLLESKKQGRGQSMLFGSQSADRSTHGWPGLSAGLNSIGHGSNSRQEDVEADELRVRLLRRSSHGIRWVDALQEE